MVLYYCIALHYVCCMYVSCLSVQEGLMRDAGDKVLMYCRYGIYRVCFDGSFVSPPSCTPKM